MYANILGQCDPVIKSSDINAFATENNEIALYSGLIEKSDNVNQIQGVIAHELGHLVAQHHIKSRVKNENTGIAGITGTILGVGAVIAGAPDVGMAAILGGTSADISKQLAHSREHENEADSIAIRLLDQTDTSAKGLADFFKILERQERLYFKSRPEFLNTHPTTSRRKSFVQNNIVSFEETESSIDFDVFKAKLYAFTTSPEKVSNKYSIKKDSQAKFIALAIAAMNSGEFTQSFKYLDEAKKYGLKEIWYFDMLGQVMYQKADFEESVGLYNKSKQAGNDSWILDFQIAESYFALKHKAALDYYFKSLAKYDEFNYTLKRIADFYAQDKQLTMAHVYLAKYYSKLGKKKDVARHTKLAQEFYKQENLNDNNIKSTIDELLSQTKKESK